MGNLSLEDAREYVFCLFTGKENESLIVDADSLKFLGSAFFVTKQGDAITAAHVIPSPDSLGKNEHLYAIAKKDGKTETFRVLAAVKYEESDLAICRINISDNPYLETSFEHCLAGTDVMTLGITEHDLYQQGKELRMFKGHITLAAKPNFSELNFAIPRGMSGGPVLKNNKCIGFLSANIRSEQLEDQIEEIQEIENNKEKIILIESKNIINYGIFIPFSYFHGHKADELDGKSLDELIHDRNSS